MTTGKRLWPLASILLFATACSAELSADITINSSAFTPTSCRSGQVNGFSGVDLIDDKEQTLRLVQTPANKPLVILFEGEKPLEFGECGTLSLDRQNSTINDITNVMGKATLDCKLEDRAVSGTLTFKNCH